MGSEVLAALGCWRRRLQWCWLGRGCNAALASNTRGLSAISYLWIPVSSQKTLLAGRECGSSKAWCKPLPWPLVIQRGSLPAMRGSVSSWQIKSQALAGCWGPRLLLPAALWLQAPGNVQAQGFHRPDAFPGGLNWGGGLALHLDGCPAFWVVAVGECLRLTFSKAACTDQHRSLACWGDLPEDLPVFLSNLSSSIRFDCFLLFRRDI